MTDRCDINDLITWNEPKVMVYNGTNCKTPDGGNDGYRYLPTGTFNCGYGGCDASQKIWSDAIDGLWVPPNQYVYMWQDYQSGIANNNARDVANETKKHVDITESQRNTTVVLCPAGQVVTGIDKLYYGNSAKSCGESLDLNSEGAQYLIARNSIDVNEFLNRLPDTCRNQFKTARIDYRCGNTNIFLPNPRPDGVYGPGMYDPMSVQGEFDDQYKYMPDSYYSHKARAARNTVDTVIVRRTRPWKDHLRECCFQTGGSSQNTMSKNLCGRYDGKTAAGRQYCKAFLDECSADDIKTGGKCFNLCKDNPVECDKIKQTFCRDHPSDPFCDCVNYQTRTDYINFIKKYPVLKGYPRTCTYNKCRLTDQDQVFLTQDVVKESQEAGSCADVNQIINEFSGSNNIVSGLTQTINTSEEQGDTTNYGANNQVSGDKAFITAPLSTGATGISAYITPLNLLILFVFVIFVGYLVFSGSSTISNNSVGNSAFSNNYASAQVVNRPYMNQPMPQPMQQQIQPQIQTYQQPIQQPIQPLIQTYQQPSQQPIIAPSMFYTGQPSYQPSYQNTQPSQPMY
jgi:hypothetical protein